MGGSYQGVDGDHGNHPYRSGTGAAEDGDPGFHPKALLPPPDPW